MLKKLALVLSVCSFIGGCVVDERRNCPRGSRWDGHHCMEVIDHSHDRDHDHDHDHDGPREGGVDVRDHR